VHALEVVGRVLADLDLEGAKSFGEPPLDLGPDLVRLRAVEWREQRQANLAIDLQQRVIFQHLDCGQQRRRRHLADADVGGNDGLGLAGSFAGHGRGVLAAKRPAAVAGLAARPRRDVAFAPTDAAVAVAHLHDDRLELGKGPVRQHVRPDQRQANRPQRDLLESHGSRFPFKAARRWRGSDRTIS
jgi:hypothetical protein